MRCCPQPTILQRRVTHSFVVIILKSDRTGLDFKAFAPPKIVAPHHPTSRWRAVTRAAGLWVHVTFEAYINPAVGDRNLEYDQLHNLSPDATRGVIMASLMLLMGHETNDTSFLNHDSPGAARCTQSEATSHPRLISNSNCFASLVKRSDSAGTRGCGSKRRRW